MLKHGNNINCENINYVIRNAITIINNCIKNDNNIYYKTHVAKIVYLLGQIYVV